MPLPGRDKTFALENSRCLLLKLERELDRYRRARTAARASDMIDAAFNFCVTAWHLCDWVYNDLTPPYERAELGLMRSGDLQERVRQECRSLHLCRQAATASKHWQVRQHPDPDVSVVVTADPEWTIYFIDGTKRIPVDEVFELAIGYWTPFIFQHGVAR